VTKKKVMMDEREWLAFDDPKALAHAFHYETANRNSGLLSSRKMRLIGCACCRAVWHLLPEAHRRAVEVAERYAEGRAARDEMQGAYDAADACATAAGWDDCGAMYWSVAQVVARMTEAHRQRLEIPLPDRRVLPAQTTLL
jgi:hypothetical protein